MPEISTISDAHSIKASDLMQSEPENDNIEDEESEIAEPEIEQEDIEDEDDDLDDSEGSEKEVELEIDDEIDDDLEESDTEHKLALSQEVAKALQEKERKRYEDHVKGLAKLEKRLKADSELTDRYKEWDSRLSTRETAVDALKQLIDATIQHHGFDASEVFGAKPKDSEPDDFTDEITQQVLKKLGFNPSDIKGLLKAKQESEAQTAFESKVKSLAPKAVEKLATQYSGWPVTEDMCRKAWQLFPDMKPLAAIKAAYPDSLARHLAKQASSTTRGPESLRSATKRPATADFKSMDDIASLKASDLLRQ